MDSRFNLPAPALAEEGTRLAVILGNKGGSYEAGMLGRLAS